MTTSQQDRPMTPEENFRELYARVAKLNDSVSALMSPEWGAEAGLLPEGHPLHPGAVALLPITLVRKPRLLDCGWCYEENGEECHPHPECPLGGSAEPMKTRPGDQPLPVGGQECVQDALIRLIDDRKQLGIQRYGSPLMTHNGRDASRDMVEEAVDLAVYSMQVAMELRDLRAAVERVRGIKRAPTRSDFNTLANAQDNGWDAALYEVQRALEGVSAKQAAADSRQRAYDAVYAYIRALGDEMPSSKINRNAMIWHAVNDALEATPDPAVAPEQQQRVEQLATTLDEVLRQFVHKGHAGEPCLQTGWISEETVARWRAILYPPKES